MSNKSAVAKACPVWGPEDLDNAHGKNALEADWQRGQKTLLYDHIAWPHPPAFMLPIGGVDQNTIRENTIIEKEVQVTFGQIGAVEVRFIARREVFVRKPVVSV